MARALAVPVTVAYMHKTRGCAVAARGLARPTQRAKYGLSGAGRISELRSKSDPNHARAYLRRVIRSAIPKHYPGIAFKARLANLGTNIATYLRKVPMKRNLSFYQYRFTFLEMLVALHSRSHEQQTSIQLLCSNASLRLTNQLDSADSLRVYNVGTYGLKPGA